jgi:hypothetical protein
MCDFFQKKFVARREIFFSKFWQAKNLKFFSKQKNSSIFELLDPKLGGGGFGHFGSGRHPIFYPPVKGVKKKCGESIFEGIFRILGKKNSLKKLGDKRWKQRNEGTIGMILPRSKLKKPGIYPRMQVFGPVPHSHLHYLKPRNSI